ncbi:MAG TPA: hypothetical protein ENK50_07940, partial [Sedimenticola sp.]|nr:hypothetical protein [Sedimenticola sp.]
DVFDQEVRESVKQMLTLLEPLLIVGLGLIVAGMDVSTRKAPLRRGFFASVGLVSSRFPRMVRWQAGLRAPLLRRVMQWRGMPGAR